ncbi:uncharacterized protein K02A2.6-like [Anneissia japonica]|uniref:uncharacterized protein K02A2.6-like n=1 Tax=Anneissia japonica TaxID=1529436 RepID=UPI001425AFF7|nr:uncharacterized protein K02A2.6-like [Anneissia japonica]
MIPTIEDVLSIKLSGKKLFTHIDMKDAYWQVPLTESSSKLCTFNTPFGRYSFNRLPFGLCSASEVVQKRNEQIFGDLENVFVISDDMIIATDDNEALHDSVIVKVMKRAKHENVKFNTDT